MGRTFHRPVTTQFHGGPEQNQDNHQDRTARVTAEIQTRHFPTTSHQRHHLNQLFQFLSSTFVKSFTRNFIINLYDDNTDSKSNTCICFRGDAYSYKRQCKHEWPINVRILSYFSKQFPLDRCKMSLGSIRQ